MIRNIRYFIGTIIIGLVLFIFILSYGRTNPIDEVCYAIRYDYSFINKPDRTMTINLCSNIKNPSYIDINKNIYSLLGEGDFYYTLTVRDIDMEKINDMYIFHINAYIPNIDGLYINNLDLCIENNYYSYKSRIGSIYIKQEAVNQISVKSFYGEFDDLSLSRVIIECNDDINEIKDIIISDSIFYDCSVKNNVITIEILSENLVDNIFIDLIIDSKVLFIDNFYYATLALEDKNYNKYMSLVVREKLYD